jgi:hypothetical protein
MSQNPPKYGIPFRIDDYCSNPVVQPFTPPVKTQRRQQQDRMAGTQVTPLTPLPQANNQLAITETKLTAGDMAVSSTLNYKPIAPAARALYSSETLMPRHSEAHRASSEALAYNRVSTVLIQRRLPADKPSGISNQINVMHNHDHGKIKDQDIVGIISSEPKLDLKTEYTNPESPYTENQKKNNAMSNQWKCVKYACCCMCGCTICTSTIGLIIALCYEFLG